MKFVLLTIMAFHFANFGEAQVTTSPLIPDYCDCSNLWIQKTVDFLGLSASVTPGKLAKKIMENFLDAADNDSNVGCFANYPDFRHMFSVSNHFYFSTRVCLAAEVRFVPVILNLICKSDYFFI